MGEKEKLPKEVIDILKNVSVFIPLYIPTAAHNEHNNIKLEILKILEKYDSQ